MTSEGGGAVAYPVMTLALKIPSGVARDFSLMIQSCGKIIYQSVYLFLVVFKEKKSSILKSYQSTITLKLVGDHSVLL